MSKEQQTIAILEKERQAALDSSNFRRFGELSAEISRLREGVKPQTLAGKVKEEEIFPRDTATATMMSGLIAVDDDGNFVYGSKLEVARLLLFPHLRDNQEHFDRAVNNFHARRGYTREAIIADAKKYGNPRTMSTLIERYENALAKKGQVISEVWKPFFNTAKNTFGVLSPQEFINNVLNRFENLPQIESAEEAMGFISVGRLAKRIKVEPEVLRELLRRDIFKPNKDFVVAGRNILVKNEPARRIRRSVKLIPDWQSVTPSLLETAYEESLKKEREHKRDLAKFKITDMTLADEIALGGLLTKTGMLDNISQAILDGDEPLSIAKIYDPKLADIAEHIKLGLVDVASKRNWKPISTEEHKHSLVAIDSFIEKLAQENKDVRRLPREYRSFIFLVALVNEIKHNPEKILRLRNIIREGYGWWHEPYGDVNPVR